MKDRLTLRVIFLTKDFLNRLNKFKLLCLYTKLRNDVYIKVAFAYFQSVIRNPMEKLRKMKSFSSVRLFMIDRKSIRKESGKNSGKRVHTYHIHSLEYRLSRLGIPSPNEGQARGIVRKNSSDLVIGQPAKVIGIA